MAATEEVAINDCGLPSRISGFESRPTHVSKWQNPRAREKASKARAQF